MGDFVSLVLILAWYVFCAPLSPSPPGLAWCGVGAEGGVRHAEYADKKLTQLIDTQLTNGEVYVLVHSRVQVS